MTTIPNLLNADKTAFCLALLGQEQFNQSTRPTVRRDGSALVAGDRWYDTTDGLWWRWDGTYWKSEQLLDVFLLGDRQQATAGFGLHSINQSYDLWLERFSVTGSCTTIGDASNRWFVNLERADSADTSTLISQIFQNTAATTRFMLTNSLGLHMDISALGALALLIRIFKTNAPADLNDFVARVSYRLVKA